MQDTSRPPIAPELPEDFVRNFLFRHGLGRTFDVFQQEWFELAAKGHVQPSSVPAPDIYAINQAQSDELESLRAQITEAREAAGRAQSSQEKMRKERDFHRLQHRRVLQEKQELMQELKRLRLHCQELEPQVTQLEGRYDTLLRQNMLTTIDRDRAKGQVSNLQATLRQSTAATPVPPPTAARMSKTLPPPTAPSALTQRPKERTMPPDAAPDLRQTQPLPSYRAMTPARLRALAPGPAISAHAQAASCLAAHPQRNVVVSGSDDASLRLWDCPKGTLIGALEGHRGWVSACTFSSSGEQLLSASGDATLKLWDVERQACVATLAEHSHPVWGCALHHSGAFAASASMDGTAKVWDLAAARARLTLRAHRDSVNSVAFQYLSNTLATGSADRTVVVWDGRTGLPTRTLRSHAAPVSHAVFSKAGDRLASIDGDGAVVLWDMRTLAPVWTAATPAAATHCSFDPSGSVLAVGGEDGCLRVLECADGSVACQLATQTDAVLDVAFAASGDYLAAAAADGSVRLWS